MTHEWMLKTLTKIGFKYPDAEVYLSLTRDGSQTAREIAEALKTEKRRIYRSLENLKAKGFVYANNEHPTQFSALSFEKVLETLTKANVEEANRLETEKERILSRWRALIREDSAN